MDKITATMLSLQIVGKFLKSDYYKGKETLEQDLKKYINDNSAMIEEMKMKNL